MNPRGEEEEAEEDGAVVAAGMLTKTFFKHQIVVFNIEFVKTFQVGLRVSLMISEFGLTRQVREDDLFSNLLKIGIVPYLSSNSLGFTP